MTNHYMIHVDRGEKKNVLSYTINLMSLWVQ